MLGSSALWSASAMPVVIRSSVCIYLLYLCPGAVLVHGLSALWYLLMSAVPVPMPKLSVFLFTACFLIF